jgi:hypothetical protein
MQVESLYRELDSVDQADMVPMLSALVGAGSVHTVGGTVLLTSVGRKQALLVSALCGAAIGPILRELQERYSLSKYQLIESNMAGEFIRRVHARPGAGAIYLCSPWLGFTAETSALLTSVISRGETGKPSQLFVHTRRKQRPEGLALLEALGAAITFNESLHAKLYIREPGGDGGYSLAVLGSQNLTRSNYDELGIAVINDGVINARLISYFNQLSRP